MRTATFSGVTKSLLVSANRLSSISINPNDESVPESVACLWCGADKIRDCDTAGLDDAITQPAHPTRLFYPVVGREAEVFIYIGANFIGIEQDGSKHWRKNAGEGGLARAGKPHNQDFCAHEIVHPIRRFTGSHRKKSDRHIMAACPPPEFTVVEGALKIRMLQEAAHGRTVSDYRSRDFVVEMSPAPMTKGCS